MAVIGLAAALVVMASSGGARAAGFARSTQAGTATSAAKQGTAIPRGSPASCEQNVVWCTFLGTPNIPGNLVQEETCTEKYYYYNKSPRLNFPFFWIINDCHTRIWLHNSSTSGTQCFSPETSGILYSSFHGVPGNLQVSGNTAAC
jgi:hypothetical protein